MDVNKSIIIKGNNICYNGKEIVRFDANHVYSIKDNKPIATFSYEGEYTVLNLLFGSKENFFIKKNDDNIYRQKDLKIVAISNVSVIGDLSRLATFLYIKHINNPNKQVTKPEKITKDIPNDENKTILPPRKLYPSKEESYKKPVELNNNSNQKKSDNVPISSNNESGSNILVSLIGVLFGILYVIVTFMMIPTTWSDIPNMFIQKDWLGIIIILAFFIAGIISLIYLFNTKKPKFLDCLGFLLIADVIAGIFSIIVSIVFLIFDSSFKFVGLYIIDIPLCILAGASISFQLAFPIAIVILIITGITCLIKKYLYKKEL